MGTLRCSGHRGGTVSAGGCLPRGVYSGVSAQGGVPAWGCLPRGVYQGCLPMVWYLPGGVCPGGICQEGLPGVSAPVHAGIYTPPPPWTESQIPVKT